MEIDEVDET